MQCAVWSSSIKNTKPKRTQKGMQNQSMMPSGLPTWCQLGGHTHTHTLLQVQLQLQLHKLQGSWPQCGRNRSSAWRLTPPSSAGPSGQAQSIKRVKRRNAQGTRGLRSREAVQAHKTNGVNLQFLSRLLSFCVFFASALCVCVSARLRLSRVSVLKCPFLLANEAGQNGCWPQHSRCVRVCVRVCVCVCPLRLVCLHWCESCRVQ